MALSRRAFVRGSAATAALAATGCGHLSAETTADATYRAPEPPPLVQSNPGEQPPPEVIALNRIAYGPRPGDVEQVRKIGLAAYVDEQLNPDDADDALCNQRLNAATLHIAYEGEGDYAPTDEQRLLTALSKPLGELWELTNWEIDIPWEERIRPLEEVRAATWIRAVYSKWQLREVLVEFWHNHFNVNAYNDDSAISATWPLYDRDVIRTHSLGNFRAFLEAVATSPAMMYYLNNATSKASPANENYARELFELHTLGAGNYLNDRYQHWRDVPGALEGKPIGYIDEDVYEAARAFTGWTIADGTETEGDTFPNTGEFYYYDGRHDNYQKRVLGNEFDPNQPPLVDGRKVLDLVAFHPGTAQHICTKLCRRFVADNPPETLVQRAVSTWIAAQQAPDQIKQTVRTILLSPEFAQTWGQKVKRPFEQVVSFLRATNADVTPNAGLWYLMAERGYQLFEWPAPNGHPDVAGYWLSSNVMLGRWNLLLALQSDWLEAAAFDLPGQMPPEITTSRQIVTFWVDRLLGQTVAEETFTWLLDFMAQGDDPDAPPEGDDEDDLSARLSSLVALIGMTPEFQWR